MTDLEKTCEFLAVLAVRYPIIQAPMALGADTPALAAAVSNSGGLGPLGAGYLKPDQISGAIRQIHKLTIEPFNMNLFAGGYDLSSPADPNGMLSVLDPIHRVLGLSPPSLPSPPTDSFDEQLEVILAERPAVFSFTFGIPSRDAMRRLRERSVVILGTATTPDEAVLLEQSGVTAIVAQGAEAGAHRGTFAASFEGSMVPTLELVASICQRTSLPVIASGG